MNFRILSENFHEIIEHFMIFNDHFELNGAYYSFKLIIHLKLHFQNANQCVTLPNKQNAHIVQ